MNFLKRISLIFLTAIVIGFFTIALTFFIYGKNLPNFDKLSYYQPRLVSKIFTSNGNFLEDYSNENRIFINYNEIPRELINCFLVSEDINFYNHFGVDFKGITRAFIKNMKNIFSDRRPEGASTITQQVAKNLLLTNELSYSRKIKEMILSLRMENVLSKERIMELYLNEIYLGNGSYGIASASLNYFNKSLSDLEVEEMALLAALPKAPSSYNPYKSPIKAMKRRNWVLKRLLDERFINVDMYSELLNKPIKLNRNKKILNKNASFFKEEVRRNLIAMYGEKNLYESGMTIMTTLDERIQLQAEESFRKGLKNFSKRQKWQGPIDNIKKESKMYETFFEYKKPTGLFGDKLALVTKVENNFLEVLLQNKQKKLLRNNQLEILKEERQNLQNLFKVGDLIVLEFSNNESFVLSQIPKVNGGMVVMDNQTGRVLAMVGGYDSSSSFNRSTQAKRQLGSSFKPIVYITALENGYTPISKVLDAPFVVEDYSDKGVWRPTNYGDKFYGLSTLRLGIEKSRNLMTVRLSDQLGLEKIANLSKKLGVYEEFPSLISSSLGSLESTLQRITAAYATIANGGFKVKPNLIDVIYKSNGEVLFKADNRKCINCNVDIVIKNNPSEIKKVKTPEIKNNSMRIFSEESSYQMTSFLMGVIERGTAKNINNFNFQVAGKTGTTNNNQDAWFIGYNSEITVGVFVGYDVPKSLGRFETGSKVAAPIFNDFMKKIYLSRSPKPFSIPESIKFMNIDLFSGQPASEKFITEAFKSDFNFDNIEKRSNQKKNFEFRGFY